VQGCPADNSITATATLSLGSITIACSAMETPLFLR